MAYFQHINDMGKCSQYNAVEKVGCYICSIDIKFKRKYIHRKKDHKILIVVVELGMIILVFLMLFLCLQNFLHEIFVSFVCVGGTGGKQSIFSWVSEHWRVFFFCCQKNMPVR